MIHQFWMLNSILLLLLLFAQLTLRIFSISVPGRESIRPVIHVPTDHAVHINIKKIYEYDLFNTVKPEEQKVQLVEAPPQLPPPPKIEVVAMPEPPVPTFLDPLNITLKGILVLGAHDPRNKAIVFDTKINKESAMAVGDTIYDAQLIRIFKNKAVFLRTNGQQEILYLREQDAKLDTAYGYAENWTDCIKRLDEFNYQIDMPRFLLRISNVGQLLYVLGITTAYKEGQSIGCRIGNVEQKSIGNALGLKIGDIITQIDGKSVSQATDRMVVFKVISEKKGGDQIIVSVLRHGATLTITYHLMDSSPMHSVEPPEKTSDVAHGAVQAQLHQNFHNAQQYIKNQERAMLFSGNRSRVSGEK